jgi:hypothetical protein
MRRRDFITLLGGAAAGWPLAARAQRPANLVVGLLFSGTPETNGDEVAGLLRGMSETGFVEGRNVAVEYRWNYNDPRRGVEQAADQVNRRVAVIATNTVASALRAKTATSAIPIVFVSFADAVQAGIVASLARPGGNVTGIDTMVAALGAKRFELLRELLPRARRYGVLVNPTIVGFETDVDEASVARMEPPGPAFGRPDDELRRRWSSRRGPTGPTDGASELALLAIDEKAKSRQTDRTQRLNASPERSIHIGSFCTLSSVNAFRTTSMPFVFGSRLCVSAFCYARQLFCATEDVLLDRRKLSADRNRYLYLASATGSANPVLEHLTKRLNR